MDWTEEFVTQIEAQDLADSTKRVYKLHFGVFKQFMLWQYHRQLELNEITRQVIIRFRDYLLEERKQMPASVRTVFTGFVPGLSRFLAQKGFAIDTTKIRLPREQTKAPKALSQEQADAVLALAGKHRTKVLRARNVAIFSTMLYAGLRSEEVCRLKLGHYNQGSHAFAREGWRLMVENSKGFKYREVPVSRRLKGILDHWKTLRPNTAAEELFVGLPRKKDAEWAQIEPLTLWRMAKAMEKKLGFRFTCHRLRHTFGTQFRAKHPDKIEELMAILGHENYNTTLKYTRVGFQKMAELVD